MKYSILLASALVAMSSPAGAAEPAYEDMVLTAMFDMCGSAIADELSLNDAAALKEFGFSAAPDAEEAKAASPIHGKVEMAQAAVGGGTVAIGHHPDVGLCQVVFDGPDRIAARDALKAELLSDDQGFSLEPADPAKQGPMKVDRYRKVLEPGIVAVAQLITTPQDGPTPVIIAQLGVIQE
ncbi:MAG: hypothetical protein ACK40O_08925 [Allosphingosinicella sp.]